MKLIALPLSLPHRRPPLSPTRCTVYPWSYFHLARSSWPNFWSARCSVSMRTCTRWWSRWLRFTAFCSPSSTRRTKRTRRSPRSPLKRLISSAIVYITHTYTQITARLRMCVRSLQNAAVTQAAIPWSAVMMRHCRTESIVQLCSILFIFFIYWAVSSNQICLYNLERF